MLEQDIDMNAIFLCDAVEHQSNDESDPASGLPTNQQRNAVMHLLEESGIQATPVGDVALHLHASRKNYESFFNCEMTLDDNGMVQFSKPPIIPLPLNKWIASIHLPHESD